MLRYDEEQDFYMIGVDLDGDQIDRLIHDSKICDPEGEHMCLSLGATQRPYFLYHSPEECLSEFSCVVVRRVEAE